MRAFLGLLVVAVLCQSLSAHAEPKAKAGKVRKPSICQTYRFADHVRDAQGNETARLAICLDGADKGRRPRVFTEFTEVQMADGSNWLVGR